MEAVDSWNHNACPVLDYGRWPKVGIRFVLMRDVDERKSERARREVGREEGREGGRVAGGGEEGGERARERERVRAMESSGPHGNGALAKVVGR